MTEPAPASTTSSDRAGDGQRTFVVVDALDRRVDGPFPSFDIASLVAWQADLEHARAHAAAYSETYQQHLTHARAWFGRRVARWLDAGMPAARTLPSAPDLAALDTRILARNGQALIAYLADGPSGPACPFYDRVVARYARTAHGAVLAPATVRVALESTHASLAMRQLCRDCVQHRVVAHAAGPTLGITRAEAARRLRGAAGFYRGLDPNWLCLFDDAGVWGRWARYCRRSVLLPGVTAASAYWAARELLRAAAIDHGLDAGEPSRALRHVLLHCAQWWLTSEPRPVAQQAAW